MSKHTRHSSIYPGADSTVADTSLIGATPLALTAAEQETVDTLYADLKPEATAGARDYVLNRTPVQYQDAMKAKIDADWPLPPEGELEARQATKRHDFENQQRMQQGHAPVDTSGAIIEQPVAPST